MSGRLLERARILVTGASSGIGRELALALAKRQAQLILVARREALLLQLCRECRQLGGSACAVAGDIADEGVRAAACETAKAEYGGLDVLVNNAGVSAHGQFVDSDPTALRQVMEVNFFAAVELTRLALPMLLRKDPSRTFEPPAVVNVGSILGYRGVPMNNEYCASKFALRGWTESLRTELAARGVDVILISPGSTETEFFDHLVAKKGDLPWGASKGVAPSVVAQQTIHALQQRRYEAFPNWRGRLMALANRWFPSLVEWRLRSYGRRIQ